MYKEYTSIFGVNFDANESEIISILGDPLNTKINDIGYRELAYSNGTYRLSRNKLKEISLDIEKIPFAEKEITFRGLKTFLQNNDPELFETVGFYVSPRYGLSFDPKFPSWVTFFAKTELKQWQNT